MDDEKLIDRVQNIPIAKLVPFKDHPFRVVEDESMLRTTESISMFGVLTPLIARPTEDGKFEIISGHIPVKILGDVPVMTDGHTRAIAALLCGLDRVPFCWDEDDLDWEMYRRCVQECRKRDIFSPADLLGRIIPESEYDEKWNQWCDRMQAEVIRDRIVIKEQDLDDALLDILIRLSTDWEAENSCYGYRKNEKADIEGNRIFIAKDGENFIGYLFGYLEKSERSTSIMPDGTPVFEVEELYVKPEYRSKGIGKMLFTYAESAVRNEADYIMLSTATKNWRAIFHFYLDELGMEFWSARLFKKVAHDETVI